MSVDPSNWSNVPHKNRTAWADFIGTHWLWHRNLAQHVTVTLGTSYRVYPIGDGGGPIWLHAVQDTYVNACTALGIAPPSDLSGFDLEDAEDFASWTFLVSQTATRLRDAAAFN